MHPMLATLLLGLALGLKHATEADHVIAVTTMVGQERRLAPAAAIGALWGAGHSAALIILGGILVALGARMPPHLAALCDQAVAVMLVLLGGSTFWSLWRRRRQALAHARAHAQAHALGVPHAHGLAPRPWWRSVAVGFVHGASGTAALTLLVLTTLPSRLLAVAYIVIFGLGSIGGMAVLSTALALPFSWSARRVPSLERPLQVGAALASVTLGVLLATGVLTM